MDGECTRGVVRRMVIMNGKDIKEQTKGQKKRKHKQANIIIMNVAG